MPFALDLGCREHCRGLPRAGHRNLDRTYVSGIERGRRNPTLDIIRKFADTLGVDVADLFPVADADR